MRDEIEKNKYIKKRVKHKKRAIKKMRIKLDTKTKWNKMSKDKIENKKLQKAVKTK